MANSPGVFDVLAATGRASAGRCCVITEIYTALTGCSATVWYIVFQDGGGEIIGYFVTFKVDRRVLDAAKKVLEFKFRYSGAYVATVQIDLIKKSYEVVDGSFDGVAIPDENIPPGQTREDILFRNLVDSATHWLDNVWMNQQ